MGQLRRRLSCLLALAVFLCVAASSAVAAADAPAPQPVTIDATLTLGPPGNRANARGNSRASRLQRRGAAQGAAAAAGGGSGGGSGRKSGSVVVGPGPGWVACLEAFAKDTSPGFDSFAALTGARTLTAAGPGRGWWRPSPAEEKAAAALGVEYFLVPGLTRSWTCATASGCLDALQGTRGDALLVVPRGWSPNGAPPAAAASAAGAAPTAAAGAAEASPPPAAGGSEGGAERSGAAATTTTTTPESPVAAAGAAAAGPPPAAARRRVLYIHGGGPGGAFVRGSPFTLGYPLAAARLANATGAPVLVPDITLAPAGSWRDQAHDAAAALRWLANWSGAIRSAAGGACRPGACAAAAGRPQLAAGLPTPKLADLVSRKAAEPSTFPYLVVAGDGAGATAALQALLVLGNSKAQPKPPAGAHELVAAAVLWAPLTDPVLALGPTGVTNQYSADAATGAIHGDASLPGVKFSEEWAKHVPRVRDWLRGRSNDSAAEAGELEAASPLWARNEPLRRLPPTTIQVGSYDRLLADGVEMAENAAAAGARAFAVDVYDGMWHGFQLASQPDGCGGGPIDSAALSLRRAASFVRAYSGEGREAQGDAAAAAFGSPGEPEPAAKRLPERLGFPRVHYHTKWPSRMQRTAVQKYILDWAA